MTEKKTLLAQLSSKFSQHPELVATESLGHILAGSEPAREALRAFLQSYGPDIGTIATVRTEASGDDLERPDLGCSDKGGEECLLIEAKFWAGLTDNQPVTYLRRLEDEQPSALLVVAPAQRFETLWPKLMQRVVETEDIAWLDEGEDKEAKWALTGKHRMLMLTSWRLLLNSLATRTNAAGDIQTSNDIQQLQGLSDLQDLEEFLPLRPEQLAPEFPRFYRHLIQLVDAATERIYSTNWANKKGMQRTWVESGLHQYMELGGYYSWFGLRYDFWAQYRETPLWFGFQDGEFSKHERDLRSKLKPFELMNPPRFIESQQAIPISLLTGAEYSTVLDDVVNQLKEIADLLQSPQH